MYYDRTGNPQLFGNRYALVTIKNIIVLVNVNGNLDITSQNIVADGGFVSV